MTWVLSESAPGMHVRFGLDERVAALAHLGRILWLQGFPEQSLRAVGASIAEAQMLNHANSLCVALCSGAYVTAMTGDLKATEAYATGLTECAERHGLAMWHVDGRAIKGWIAVRRGEDASGMLLLRGALHDRRGTRVELRHTIFVEAMSEALAVMDRVDEGLSTIQKALDECSRNDSQWRLPELFRLRGEFALRGPHAGAFALAEHDFLKAFDLAAGQDARSWQLRAAMSLARLWRSQGDSAKALNILTPALGWYTEGFETADLQAAKHLLATL